mgnify:CR=1 FL=1
MKITDKEVNWSLDIKRSVLMMMQQHLQSEDSSINPSLLYNDLEQNNSTNFVVLEVKINYSNPSKTITLAIFVVSTTISVIS